MSSFEAPYSRRFSRPFLLAQGRQGVYFFSESDINTWYEANADRITKTNYLYIIPGTTEGNTFVDVLTGSRGAPAEIQHTLVTLDESNTLANTEKYIIIGDAVEQRVLLLRFVKVNNSAAPNSDYSGYVVVENNSNDLQANTDLFTVGVVPAPL